LDGTATVFLGTLGLGFAGLAWRIFSQLDSLQDPKNPGSFEKRLDDLYADFQVLSVTPQMLSVLSRALQSSMSPEGQTDYLSHPEAQVELRRVGGWLAQLTSVGRASNASMESLSSAGVIGVASAVYFLSVALMSLVYFPFEVFEVSTTVLIVAFLGVSFFYSKFRLRKGIFLEKERNFRSFVGA
jgi:hypothetical protein